MAAPHPAAAGESGTGLLLTDRYQLNMLQADLDAGMNDRAQA